MYGEWMKKENRDAEYKKLKAQGLKVRKTSIRNQLLHPQYVNDWPHPLSDADKGFGNTIYKTHFAVLYGIENILGW
jgi:hypothetical protein